MYDYFTDGGIEFCFSLCDEVDRVMYYPNLNVYNYFTDGGIEFRFSLCDEVDHLIDTEYIKPLQFMDIANQRLAEQLTFKDAVSYGGGGAYSLAVCNPHEINKELK